MDGHLTMKEAERLELMTRIAERRLTERAAAEQMGLSERQVRRLYRSCKRDGAAGLKSGHRGKPSNRRVICPE
ncbi:MAG: transposase [Kiritimatiellia bacterium]|jgi:transposase